MKLIEYYSKILILSVGLLSIGCQSMKDDEVIEVVVIGEGTGGATAAIQSARSGAQTMLITPLPWIGGMLTSAGVSAIDGNNKLPAGLWGEWRDSLRQHYGGADSLFTGWVSNTLYEPKVGEHYWKQIANGEDNLTIIYNSIFSDISKDGELWKVNYRSKDESTEVRAKVVIDGTDLGDVAAMVGATYDIGMDANASTGESMAPAKANDIIQDLTYAATLKDYGEGADMTIPRPEDYDPNQFYCSCQDLCDDPTAEPHPCQTMLDYGKLPNGKYMINWPINGNDYYANIINMAPHEREEVLQKAKEKTLQFVYFIQSELGYKHLGIAAGEFPTEDGLPLMPYHREGRRIHGLVQLNVNHILNPHASLLYRTGIAVGDYPIDHHHYEREDAPEIDFPPVPSFSIPMGALIPKGIDNLLIADKSMSVTNIVNGSSRLQPVIIQVGQVAGMMAAMAVAQDVKTSELNVREVQQAVLDVNGYLLPFIDVSPEHPYFQNIQRVGAAGLLRGKGIPYKWANQTWFYPDQKVTASEFKQGLFAWDATNEVSIDDDQEISLEKVLIVLSQIRRINVAELEKDLLSKIGDIDWSALDKSVILTRAQLAVLLDQLLDPFSTAVGITGEPI